MKTFAVYNFGCRVNAAETNLFTQKLINEGYTQKNESPDLIFINTCSITKKADFESLGLVRRLRQAHPTAKIIVSGCANLKKLSLIPNVELWSNSLKEENLASLNCAYSPKIKDKFSSSHRFLLKVQSGCTAFCSYCTVPNTRPYLWSLPIDTAVDTVKKAIADGYQEIIITGVNLNQYTPGFSNLVKALLTQTTAPLISFGSIPVNCLDDQFISLLSLFPSRVSNFLHIPLQSGSDKILKLMKRTYTKKIILEKFKLLNSLNKNSPSLSSKRGSGAGLKFGTDIIVAFPGETKADFQETYDLCRQIGFQKIHTFRYSPRPNTLARKLYLESEHIPLNEAKARSRKIRSLVI